MGVLFVFVGVVVISVLVGAGFYFLGSKIGEIPKRKKE